jgi:hypothetical protein
MAEFPQRPPAKSPEDLAREHVARIEQDVIRERRWRIRRQWYWLVTVTAGVVIPGVSLAAAGAMSQGSLQSWLTTSGWCPLILTVLGGGFAATVVFVRSWGISRGMMVFGGLFVVVLTVNRTEFGYGKLIAALPGLAALFVVAGAMVGYLTSMEDGD